MESVDLYVGSLTHWCLCFQLCIYHSMYGFYSSRGCQVDNSECQYFSYYSKEYLACIIRMYITFFGWPFPFTENSVFPYLTYKNGKLDSLSFECWTNQAFLRYAPLGHDRVFFLIFYDFIWDYFDSLLTVCSWDTFLVSFDSFPPYYVINTTLSLQTWVCFMLYHLFQHVFSQNSICRSGWPRTLKIHLLLHTDCWD